ncbi:hypothetical protein [Chlorobium phaeobacteroides]|jgi:hypothetical protein|uniref:Uncharacterized protein n=1 Tax=Chlorobium phaeobacteroides (strain DSM 266 / SMG 266 / 2430) TaxID=290317 RepID=A1BCV1_CHLPD|nr:hypothetical protein [Chlorobium phaeobacteroides]ABL64228.1 conserved hypothetical protein [Chlorobium phaeobacteroides DSM 266]MBV5319945.1 hypothetical protein [Chlorobium phaeobacteroides]
MKSFIDAVKNNKTGFVIKNSVFLPFHCEILTIWLGKEMSLLSTPDLITDLTDAEILGIREGNYYTNLVFRKRGDLAKELGHHKGHIILRAAEKGADIFQVENIHYVRIGFHDHHKELSLEMIDNPFDL